MKTKSYILNSRELLELTTDCYTEPDDIMPLDGHEPEYQDMLEEQFSVIGSDIHEPSFKKTMLAELEGYVDEFIDKQVTLIRDYTGKTGSDKFIYQELNDEAQTLAPFANSGSEFPYMEYAVERLRGSFYSIPGYPYLKCEDLTVNVEDGQAEVYATLEGLNRNSQLNSVLGEDFLLNLVNNNPEVFGNQATYAKKTSIKERLKL